MTATMKILNFVYEYQSTQAYVSTNSDQLALATERGFLPVTLIIINKAFEELR